MLKSGVSHIHNRLKFVQDKIMRTMSDKKCVASVRRVLTTHQSNSLCVEMACNAVIALCTNERLVAVEPLAYNQVRRPGARHGARCRAGEPQRAQLYAWWCLQWVPLQLSRLAREASYVLAQELVYRI